MKYDISLWTGQVLRVLEMMYRVGKTSGLGICFMEGLLPRESPTVLPPNYANMDKQELYKYGGMRVSLIS